MVLVAHPCHDSRVMTCTSRTGPASKTALALLTAVAFGCSAGTSSAPSLESEIAPPPTPVATPARVDDGPLPDGGRDDVVFERLVNDGFSEAEADCLARSLTIATMVSTSPDELIAVYASCAVDLDRLIELGEAPGG
jgi:hypothetical protein